MRWFEPGVRLEVAGEVARLWVDQPPLNLLTTPVLEAFCQAVAEVSGRRDLRALVVSGAGERAFVAGVDIGEMAGFDPVRAHRFIARLHAAFDDLRRLRVPVIARIDGYAIGGGLELAVACDLRVASDRSMFGMPEVRVGIPSVIEAALIPRLIGAGRAMEFLLTGEPIDAATALAWGLVNRVLPAADLDTAVDQMLATLRRCAPGALATQKWLVYEWQEAALSHAIRTSMDAFAHAYLTDEPHEGMTAFRAKRPPRWA